MSDFEFEFNQQDRDLVLSQTQDTFGLPTDFRYTLALSVTCRGIDFIT